MWGLTSWEGWPATVRWGMAAALALCAAPPIAARWTGAVAAVATRWNARDLSRQARGMLAIGFALLCWFGRSGNIYYGDGIVVTKIARSHASLLHYAGFNDGRATAEQVVEFALHRGVYDALQTVRPMEPYDTIALTHAACGGALIWLLTALFAGWWPTQGARQLAALALFCSMGVIQLWFGHLETYTIGSTCFVGFLAAGSRALRGRTGLWRPAAWATVAMTLHSVFGGLLLGLAWVWSVCTRGAPPTARVRAAVWVVLPPVCMVVGIVLAYRALDFTWPMIIGFFGRADVQGATFVPWKETHNVLERYTFLSWLHLRDLLNESALTTPFGLAVLLGIGATQRTRPFRGDPVPVFLVAGTLVYLGVIVVINPPGGGRREWDVFAPPAVGYGLLAIYLLLTSISAPTVRRGLAGVCALAAAAHTIPWVVANARIDLPAYIELRAAGDRAHDTGTRRIALLEYQQALAILPSPELAATCGDLAREQGDGDAALEFYRLAVRWENRSELAAFGPWEHVWVASGHIYEARGDHEAAMLSYREALRVGEERHYRFPEYAEALAGIERLEEREPIPGRRTPPPPG